MKRLISSTLLAALLVLSASARVTQRETKLRVPDNFDKAQAAREINNVLRAMHGPTVPPCDDCKQPTGCFTVCMSLGWTSVCWDVCY